MPTEADRNALGVFVDYGKRRAKFAANRDYEGDVEGKRKRVRRVFTVGNEARGYRCSFAREFNSVDLKTFVTDEPMNGVVRGGVVDGKCVIVAMPRITTIAEAIWKWKENGAFAPLSSEKFVRCIVPIEHICPGKPHFGNIGCNGGYDIEAMSQFGVVEAKSAVGAEIGFFEAKHDRCLLSCSMIPQAKSFRTKDLRLGSGSCFAGGYHACA